MTTATSATTTEKPSITVERWLAALRAGGVTQGSHYLMQEFDYAIDGPDACDGADTGERPEWADEYDKAFCCLGLACELSGLGRWAYQDAADHVYGYVIGEWSMGAAEVPPSGFSTGTMPDDVRIALGLRTNMGEFVVTKDWLARLADASPDAAMAITTYLGAEAGCDTVLSTSLAGLNDNGLTFSQIADIIENRPPGLFESQA